MTALGMFLFGLGVFLIWCAVKGQDPREVIKTTIRGNR